MWAFADDTATVVMDYTVTVPCIGRLFSEFERISALGLNIAKTVFIPLWLVSNKAQLRKFVRELYPPWKDISIKDSGKYLGFFVGPGAGLSSWDKPVRKYHQRAKDWSAMHLGLFYNTQVYRTFVVSVLSFVMQLMDDPPDLGEHFAQVVRLLAPGPGNWISLADASHLEKGFGFHGSFQNPCWTSLAAKMRVAVTVANDHHTKAVELESLILSRPRRPFPEWNSRSFFTVLDKCMRYLSQHGITEQTVRQNLQSSGLHGMSFQRCAETLISTRLDKTYFANARIRQKLMIWKVHGVPAHLENRILRNFRLLKIWCSPRVLSIYFKTVWNGWVTDDRMKELIKKQGRVVRPCVLGCGREVDRVEHYGRCSVYWQFLSRNRPAGIGIPIGQHSAETFLMLSELCDEDKVR